MIRSSQRPEPADSPIRCHRDGQRRSVAPCLRSPRSLLVGLLLIGPAACDGNSASRECDPDQVRLEFVRLEGAPQGLRLRLPKRFSPWIPAQRLERVFLRSYPPNGGDAGQQREGLDLTAASRAGLPRGRAGRTPEQLVVTTVHGIRTMGCTSGFAASPLGCPVAAGGAPALSCLPELLLRR